MKKKPSQSFIARVFYFTRLLSIYQCHLYKIFHKFVEKSNLNKKNEKYHAFNNSNIPLLL